MKRSTTNRPKSTREPWVRITASGVEVYPQRANWPAALIVAAGYVIGCWIVR